MIDTQSDAERLYSIDAATSLGRLADAIVMAASHRLSSSELTDADRAALRAASTWLDRLSRQIEHPLDLSLIGESNEPGLFGFGSEMTDVAVSALGSAGNPVAEARALQQLKAAIDATEAGTLPTESVTHVLEVFESMARAMLAASGSLLRDPNRSLWALSSNF